MEKKILTAQAALRYIDQGKPKIFFLTAHGEDHRLDDSVIACLCKQVEMQP